MTRQLLYLLAGAASYLTGGVNPAIVLSNLIYRQDIRTVGSKNPGFTNFKRVFGNRYAWFVFALDLLKSVGLCLIFCPLLRRTGVDYGVAAAYVGLCAMVGHAFPVWYGFRGGKGFLVGAAAIWFVDWRVGLIALGLWGALLFATKYMSLSVIAAALACPAALACLGAEPAAVWLCAAASALMIARHHENIRRLLAGTESRFRLLGQREGA